MAVCKNVYYLPLCLFILVVTTLFVTYIVAVLLDHVSPALPYISETGAFSPERSIFSQMFNLAALLMGICVYIRHRIVFEFSKLKPDQIILRGVLNRISTLFGILSCFGLNFAANFNEAELPSLHMAGALLCFSTGTMYFCLQTLISTYTTSTLCSLRLVYTRGFLSLCSFILTVGTIIPGFMSVNYYHGSDYKKWGEKDGGYGLHMISTVSEWLLAFIYCLFILTFVSEFKHVHIYSPNIELGQSFVNANGKSKELTHSNTMHTVNHL